MRAKKLTTREEDGVMMVLKGEKHITSSISTDPQLKASAQTSIHNWGSLESGTGVSADSVNSADRNRTLDNKHSNSLQQERKVICGKSNFLSRFIECRINDNKLCAKMTSGAQNGNESGSMGIGNVTVLVDSSVCENHAAVEPFADGIDSIQSEISPHQLPNDSMRIRDKLSGSDMTKEDNGSVIQSEDLSLKQCEVNTDRNIVIGDPVTNVLYKIPAIRRVEELRIRIEGNVENTNYVKERKNVHSKVKNCKNEGPIKKNATEAQEDGHKLEIKRSGSNTKEIPPRKVSFKVRSTSNNGRLSSSYMSTAGSRRSSTLNKGLLADARAPNLSSKVAALASKFNAIILENKEERSVEIIQNDSKKKLLVIPQLAAGSITTASKKQPPTEKVVVSRRNSSNSKRESSLSNHGNIAKVASLGVALRKHSSARQPILETDSHQKLSANSSTKDCKRRSNVSYRPSAVGSKSGSVKAAIQIFEKNATSSPSAKSSAVVSGGNKMIIGDCSVGASDRSLQSAEARKEPKYPRVIFKRDTTLVRVPLDCEDVCNGDRTPEEVEDGISTQTSHCHTSASKLPRGNCEEGKENVSYNIQGKSDQNVTVVTVKGSSGQTEKEPKQTKSKPAVPVKKVTGEQIHKSVPFSKNSIKDSSYAKVISNAENIYRTISNVFVAENTFVRYDKLAFPQRAPSVPESSTNKIPTTQETDNSQQRDRELMAPNKSFLWGASPPGTSARTQDDQSTSVPAPETKDCGSANPEDLLHETNDNADDIYDDVYPPSAVFDETSSIHPYSMVEPQDDDVYDDVGPPVHEEKQSARVPKVTVSVSICADGDGTESGYDYCRGSMGPSLEQNYDDCEGEGYQCIGEDNSHEDTESNIYDDVKSVTTLRMSDDVASVSNCYESIYSGSDVHMTADLRTTIEGSAMRAGGSSASSSVGNHSFCDQSNSLYGVGGSRFDSASVSQASTVSAEDGAHEVLSYQLTCMGSRQPRSETSDEWVDVEMTDSEGEGSEEVVAVCQGRPRSRRSPRRSRKMRKQWSKSAQKATGNLVDGDHSSDSDADHHYEMLCEVAGDSKIDAVPYDDFDSFDSDVSDETYIKPLHQAGCDIANGRLPEPPSGQNIYGISKIAEAAGKKMLKLGKSLRKIRTKRNSNSAAEVQHKACPPLPTTPRPPPPSPPSSLPSPPVPPPRISEKSVSSGNLAGRKYWSLRKFRRSVSASDQTPPTSPCSGPKKETATFYLTQALDADTGSVEGNVNRKSSDVTDNCSENYIPTSPSSMGSSKTVVYDSGVEANYSSEGLQKTLSNFTDSKKQRPTSAPERKNSGSIRPNSPPPLPPQSSGSSDNPKKPPRKEKRSSGNTSWYAECGLFDQTEVQNIGITDAQKRNIRKQDRPISNSWYAEVGLWDMSTSSPNDSSLSEQDARSQHTDFSGGDSPLTAGSPENSGVVERRFADEPLYQFYTAGVVERDMRSELDSDGYEEIGDSSQKLRYSRPTAMELIQPREGQHRTLWCEIPEVVSSHVLSTMSAHQKKLQEAKFEIITSEASYINSLNVLEKHFMSSLEACDESVLSKNDRRTLFSNLIPVKTCSEHFLAELEKCWQDNILLNGICEVVYKHASNNFSAYVKYCSNQICLDRTLRGLKEQNTKFSEVLLQLESNPVCQSLSLHSFLMLPMQRITRLPLLMDALLTRLDPQDDEYSTCQLALATLNKIVQNCNEDARRMERMEEILILSPQLYFPNEVKAIPIISSTRWLVKKGELTQLVWRDEGKLTFGKKFSRIQIHIFLFTDLLVITKKKRRTTPDATGDECYCVVDYCPRNLVQMTSAEGMTHLPVKFTSDGGRNMMLLTMLQNHEKKTVEMVLSCSMESDRQRWLEAVSPPVSDNPDETVYEEWDCPQVTAIHPYVARQPDELSLEVADVVNVLRKITDGWYQGERIRDGERGWFPGNHTVEVLSAHVRARNLKQRYRLLALSGNFLEAQRKEKQAK